MLNHKSKPCTPKKEEKQKRLAFDAVQAWQLGLQQGIQGAQASQQKGAGQVDGATGLAQTAQGRLVLEQLQRLGLFADGGGNLNSGQLQGLMTMLSKQGEGIFALEGNHSFLG